MDEKQIQEAFLQFLAKKSGAKNQKELEKYVQSLGEDGLKQAYMEFQKILQSQTQKAAHGAKLDYFRKLKNQCPEGEELYYYKKGGSIGCGCKKKEDGGEVEMAKKGTAVEKFKKGQFGLRTNELVKNHQDKKREEEKKKKKANTWGASTKYIAKPKNEDPNKMPQDSAVPDEDIPSHDRKANRKKCGGKVEKDCGGAVAKFKAKCGSKLKKHQQGGSLNGIPFMQAGTPEGGIRTTIEFPKGTKKEIILPEYMSKQQIGYPTVLPGRYSGLEKPTMGIVKMFKTYIKGLPKTLTTKDYLIGTTGVIGGTALGYDDTHNQYIRKGLQKANDIIDKSQTINWKPFSFEYTPQFEPKPFIK